MGSVGHIPKERPDPLTFDFFNDSHAQHEGSEAQHRRSHNIRETLEHIKIRWVLDNWEEEQVINPGWSERQHVWPDTPDWVVTRDLRNIRKYHLGYMSKWLPNRDHPWMRQVYSHMPEFRPVIMFRLCTDMYYVEKGTIRRGRLGRWDDHWRARRLENSNTL